MRLAPFLPGWLLSGQGGGARAAAGSWQAGLWEHLDVPSEFPPPPLPRLFSPVSVCVCVFARAVFAAGSVVP